MAGGRYRQTQGHDTFEKLFSRQPASRDFLVFGILLLFLAVIAGRLVYLQVNPDPRYEQMAENRTPAQTILAKRGTIYDRNGEILATDTEATTITVNPTEVTDPENLAQTVYEVLGKKYGKSYDDYYELVTAENTQYRVIQRQCTVKLANKLSKRAKKAGLVGLYYEDDVKRVYPNGSVASQLVGSVDVDRNGIAGLELQYDGVVAGTDGSKREEYGADGTKLPDGVIEQTDAVDGNDIVTSIDVKLQEKVEKSLKEAISEYSAQGGTATVVDASTGEIYASASYAKTDGKYQLEVGKLGAATDAYEPGSTFKVVTAASLLANSSVTPSTTFTVPAKLEVYDATITDSHDHGTENMTLRQIIAESSNIGTVLASRKVTGKQLYKTYRAFGFGKNPGTDFPGVTAGQLQKASEWDGVQAANVTFGQGVLVSGLQILRAYGAIEQEGTLRVPHFLTSVTGDEQRTSELATALGKTKKAAGKKVCKNVTSMMKSVVKEGTGTDAAIDGFTVAGKTGTAEIADSSGGYGDGYIVSFAGWLAGSSSDLVCLVTIDRPKTEEGGGPVCGPVFADIMSFAIDRYQIAPTTD